MMLSMAKELDHPEDGPATAALTEKQRGFLFALLENGGNQTAAAMTSFDTKDLRSAQALGSMLARHPKVIAALKEEADKRIRAGAVLAIDVMIEIMQSPGHKDRFKAAVEVANRSGLLVIQQIDVNHNHHVTSSEMIQRIEALSRQLGLDPVKLLGSAGVKPSAPEPIDVEFTEVPADPFAWSPS